MKESFYKFRRRLYVPKKNVVPLLKYRSATQSSPLKLPSYLNTLVSMRGERFKKVLEGVPRIFSKAIEIANYPKIAHKAVSGNKVVFKFAKETE